VTNIGVEDGKEQLMSINMSDLVDDIFAEDTIEEKATQFASTLRAILSLVQNCTTSADGSKPSPVSVTTSNVPKSAQKRPAEHTTTEENAKRTKVSSKPSSPEGPHTPDQPAVAPNPNYTGNSDSSGGSIESTDEELTRALLRNFLDDTRGFLRLDFRVLDWTRSGLKTDLAIRQIRFLRFTDDRTHTTRFRLGVERITAKNDGGLSIRYEGSKIWGGDRMPVLSLEVIIPSCLI
jgi:hypothetical protein